MKHHVVIYMLLSWDNRVGWKKFIRRWEIREDVKSSVPCVYVWNVHFRRHMAPLVRQNSLCYKDLTLRHFIVINKCQTRTSDKLEKHVHSVVLLCSICRNLYKEHSRMALIFFHIWRKLLLNHSDYFEKLMVNVLHRKIGENDGFKSGDFDTRQERRQGTRKTSKNSKMWNCKHCWT